MEDNFFQKLNLDLLSHVKCNNLNGAEVRKVLEKYSHLIMGAVFTGEDLIPLRDIHKGIWNCATLYLTVRKENLELVMDLMRGLQADEITEEKDDLNFRGEVRAIRVWWD